MATYYRQHYITQRLYLAVVLCVARNSIHFRAGICDSFGFHVAWMPGFFVNMRKIVGQFFRSCRECFKVALFSSFSKQPAIAKPTKKSTTPTIKPCRMQSNLSPSSTIQIHNNNSHHSCNNKSLPKKRAKFNLFI